MKPQLAPKLPIAVDREGDAYGDLRLRFWALVI